jgi:hypothetical protein
MWFLIDISEWNHSRLVMRESTCTRYLVTFFFKVAIEGFI